MPRWVCEGVDDYINRMPSDYRTHFIEIPMEKRGKNADISKIILTEEHKITTHIPKDSVCIALDRIGKTIDTVTLAKHLQTWHDNREEICFIIGGPEGLSEPFLKKANQIWSLSAMTLPHPLVRIVLTEQLYRAWSITVNHPYHR